jgi:hypothetical protein
MTRSPSQSQSATEVPPPDLLVRFYREEFLEQLECLRLQRDCYSAAAVASAEQALDRILAHLDAWSARRNAAEVFSRLLASFDCVTGVSWQRDRSHTN